MCFHFAFEQTKVEWITKIIVNQDSYLQSVLELVYQPENRKRHQSKYIDTGMDGLSEKLRTDITSQAFVCVFHDKSKLSFFSILYSCNIRILLFVLVSATGSFVDMHIMLTPPYIPLQYIVKLGFTGVYIISYFCSKTSIVGTRY